MAQTDYTVQDVVQIMDAVAPRRMACEGDPVGLHAGDFSSPVRKVLLALDASFSVIEDAVDISADMLVTHHPRFFRPLVNMDESRRDSRIAAMLVRSNMALFCAHTNLDVAPGGVNDMLADLAGMDVQRKPLKTVYRDTVLKLSVFVPEESLEEVRRAVCGAGAGEMGDYTECCYRLKGVGMFRPMQGAQPHIGTVGKLQEVPEWRLETVLHSSARKAVQKALIEAHPYEEPAFDFVTLHDSVDYGLGRSGRLCKPVSFGTLARRMKKQTGSKTCMMLGAKESVVERVAVWSGSSVPVGAVLGSGAQAVICGEMGHHEAELFHEKGIGVIVLGHWASEQPVLFRVADNLREALPGLEVCISDDCCAPFTTV